MIELEFLAIFFHSRGEHADYDSLYFSKLWIPAFAGMTAQAFAEMTAGVRWNDSQSSLE